jgi:hypothetical protein
MALQPHAAMSAKGRLILCTVLGSTPKTLGDAAHTLAGALALAQGGKDAWYAAQPATAKASVQAAMIRTVGLQGKGYKL